MSIIKGADVAKQLIEELSVEVSSLKEKGIQPRATIIRLGEDESQIAYERGATKKLESVGIEVGHILLPVTTSQEEFMEVLSAVNQNPSVNGILLLRPLPKHLDEKAITEAIDPMKDIDAISPYNMYKVMVGDPTGFAPCTAEAVIKIIDHINLDLTGKRVVVVGQSMVVGRPLSLLMLNRNATVTMCHIFTKNLPFETKQAEVLVVAAGKRGLITGAHVAGGTVVIDVGINVGDDGKLHGDVAFEEVEPLAAQITPVPGGVGAVTSSLLAEHVVKAVKLQHGI